MRSAGFRVWEEWVWIKPTTDGQPISTLDGLWRRPHEILIIGRKLTGSEEMDMVNTTSDESSPPCRIFILTNRT